MACDKASLKSRLSDSRVGSLSRYMRPLKRILCVFDGAVVALEIDGIVAGDITEGHRFMGSGRSFRAGNLDEYSQGLAAHHVVLDAEERRGRILKGARDLCRKRDLELVEELRVFLRVQARKAGGHGTK